MEKTNCCFDDKAIFLFISIGAVNRKAVFLELAEMEKYIQGVLKTTFYACYLTTDPAMDFARFSNFGIDHP